MSSQEENLTVVRSALEAFQRRDMESFLGFLDPEIETVSSPELANPVDVVGREKWLQWVAEWLDAWETFDVEAQSFEVVGNRHVLAEMRQHGRGKGSGVEVEMRVYYMFEVRDGVATRYHLYPDREQALEAARAGEHA